MNNQRKGKEGELANRNEHSYTFLQTHMLIVYILLVNTTLTRKLRRLSVNTIIYRMSHKKDRTTKKFELRNSIQETTTSDNFP
jgi:hypothetical protein